MKCRHCSSELTLNFLDLGSAPPSNAYLTPLTLRAPEVWYPLRVLVCESCWLVQTEDHAGREALFSGDYAYFSSFSSSWLAHAQAYVQAMQQRFSLNACSTVVEVAANDGYLLQYIKKEGIPCYGIEPTASTANAAKAKGIDVVERFFGVALARELTAQGRQADLIAANNVLAHVPDINDFVAGFSQLLKPQGVATFEFPHLLRLIEQCQFDTVYHEHYSYLSLNSVQAVFVANGLEIFEVEEHPTHGGSLRVFAQLAHSGHQLQSQSVSKLLQYEHDAGLTKTCTYLNFQSRINRIKDDLHLFLLEAKRQGKVVAAYGAAAKGNTLLNYAGIRSDLIAFVVDRNPAKQGKFLPGSRIPIVEEEFLSRKRPDHILILPWNLKVEVIAQLDYARNWGATFVTAVPYLEII